MKSSAKSSQLQVRLSPKQKDLIRRAARRADMAMSEYVLSRALPKFGEDFRNILRRLATAAEHAPGFALAELHAFLDGLAPADLFEAVAEFPSVGLPPFLSNYVAAMVETACARAGRGPPGWTHRIAPLTDPVFGSTLQSLRLHLLTQSPPAFRRRNIFIDSTLGAQV